MEVGADFCSFLPPINEPEVEFPVLAPLLQCTGQTIVDTHSSLSRTLVSTLLALLYHASIRELSRPRVPFSGSGG